METPANVFKTKEPQNTMTEIAMQTFHEPAPAPPVAIPYKEIFTLPWNSSLNQPHVRPTTADQTLPKGSSGSNRYYPDKYSGSTISHAEVSVVLEDDSIFSEMFTGTFRKMKNRNRFVSKVFFFIGLQMLLSFIVYFLLMYDSKFRNRITQHWIPFFVVFTVIISALTVIMISCSKWFRKIPLVVLLFLTVSLTLQYASIGTRYNFLDFLIYSSGSLMLAFFFCSVLASQSKCEATGTVTIVLFICGSLLVSIAVVAILTLTIFSPPRWETIVPSLLATMILVTCGIFLTKAVIQATDVRATDYLFGALLIYISLTTLYSVKACIMCTRKRGSFDTPHSSATVV